MHFFSHNKTVRGNTAEDVKNFNAQFSAKRFKKGEQLVSLTPHNKKCFGLMGDDIVESSTENEPLKNKIVSHDEKWLRESKVKLLKQFNDGKKST